MVCLLAWWALPFASSSPHVYADFTHIQCPSFCLKVLIWLSILAIQIQPHYNISSLDVHSNWIESGAYWKHLNALARPKTMDMGWPRELESASSRCIPAWSNLHLSLIWSIPLVQLIYPILPSNRWSMWVFLLGSKFPMFVLVWVLESCA